jgi:hypothetical protein
MRKLVTGDVWSQVNRLLRGRALRVACIAYVTSTKLKLRKGDVLICDASRYAVKFGETSARTLQFYFKKGVQIYSNSSLHSKLLISDTILVVGSSNLSRSSAERLIETAVITDDKSLNSQAKAFIHNLTKESMPITGRTIRELLKIKVLKRHLPTKMKSATRTKEFGSKYWFVPVVPIGERAEAKIKDKVEQATKRISNREKIDPDDISFIQWPSNSVIGKQSKEGDQLVIKWSNKANTRTEVYPPTTILEKEMNGSSVIMYYNDTLSGEPISWSKFKRSIASMDLRKSFAKTSSLSEDEMKDMNTLWDAD